MSAHLPAAPEDEVVELCRDLLRIDTSNFGDGSGPGERAAGEHVMALLNEVGLDPTYLETGERRANVVVRTPGTDPSRPALCIHGHLDVVPADADDWQLPPFGAEERDGCLWGRGAVDMKDMDAMMLAVLRHLARTGARPPRDIVWAFFADEEAGSENGSYQVVRGRPELFDGVTEAVSEVGGFCVTVSGPTGPRRAYLVQTAEKAIAWVHLRATGVAGHGSVPTTTNAVVRLAEAITRIDAHRWPRRYIPAVRGLLEGLSDLTGVPFENDDCEPLLERLPGVRGFIEGSIANTANATMLSAGYKHNVVPQTATAALDCRALPGELDNLLATLRELAGPDVEVRETFTAPSLEAPYETPLVDRMRDALAAEDPEAVVLPYCLSGGTDNKALAEIGVAGYGFAPLRLPPDLPFAPMFHGIDERVPLDSLRFGARVLHRFVMNS
ncbi:MAG: M20/M25/M40 family metallo-hydrolase [Austwickia sp.]|nr:M20/M25/M40 family metallo-hydrolase [Austwickia sp.]MBK8435315.1 M20/M25/M40 family metallo-hydrolase [Austwickia sp.]MBK9101135.1 M20/M25/M40 family metallo-hydrolase [Austwickia sp.]